MSAKKPPAEKPAPPATRDYLGRPTTAEAARLVRRVNALYWEARTWAEIADVVHQERLSKANAVTLRNLKTKQRELWDQLNQEARGSYLASAEADATRAATGLLEYTSPLLNDEEQLAKDFADALDEVDPENVADLLLKVNREAREDAALRLRAASTLFQRIQHVFPAVADPGNPDTGRERAGEELEKLGPKLSAVVDELEAFRRRRAAARGNGKAAAGGNGKAPGNGGPTP